MKPIIEARAKSNLKLSEGRGIKKGLQNSANLIEPVDSVFQNSVKQTEPVHVHKELARIASVSHDTVAKVKAIEATGSAELKQSVIAGAVSINLASQLSTLPKEKQTLLLGRRYNRTKKAKGGRSDRDFGTDKVSTPNTAESLADQNDYQNQ